MNKNPTKRIRYFDQDKMFKYFEINKDNIIEDILNGMSKTDIAEKYNLGQSAYWINKFLLQNNDSKLIEKISENAKINRNKQTSNRGKNKHAQRAVKLSEQEAIDYYFKLRDIGEHREKVIGLFKPLGYGKRWVKHMHSLYPLKKYSFLGKNNPAYGKSISDKAKYGRGRTGYVIINEEKFIYRSSLELRFLLQLEEAKIPFKLCEHKIQYIKNGVDRTYFPDIQIDNRIIEIKPISFMDKNKEKFRAARQYCEEHNLEFEVWNESKVSTDLNFEKIAILIKNNKIITKDSLLSFKKLCSQWKHEKNKCTIYCQNKFEKMKKDLLNKFKGNKNGN